MKTLKAILAGTILTPTEKIEDGVVLLDGPRIVTCGRREKIKIPAEASMIDNRDRLVVPGFIDLHIHGAAGHDLMEATPEAVSAVSGFLARHGTTAFLATTVTAGPQRTVEAARRLGEIINGTKGTLGGAAKVAGAQPLGIHFEGPFINPKRRGAHPAAEIQKPSIELLDSMLDAAAGAARVITLAPELEGAISILERARGRGLRVAIGHSDATYEEAERAIAAGATHATHCFNAMRPFAHRDAGIIGAVLTDDRVCAEIICDGLHAEPAAVRLLIKCKGMTRVMAVTDSLSGAGMPEGEYRTGDITIRVAGGVCRAAEGQLAGSTLTLDAAVRNLASFAGIPYAECLPCATVNPGKLLGIEKRKGVIAPGADADLAVLDENYFVTQTYVLGRPML